MRAKGKYQQEEKIVQEMCQSEGHERREFLSGPPTALGTITLSEACVSPVVGWSDAACALMLNTASSRCGCRSSHTPSEAT